MRCTRRQPRRFVLNARTDVVALPVEGDVVFGGAGNDRALGRNRHRYLPQRDTQDGLRGLSRGAPRRGPVLSSPIT